MKIREFLGSVTTIEEVLSKFGEADIVLNGVSKEKFNSLNNELKELKVKSVDVETLTKQIETLTGEIQNRDKEIVKNKLVSKLKDEGVIYPDLILNSVDLSTVDIDKFDTLTYKEKYPSLFTKIEKKESAVSSSTGVDKPKADRQHLIDQYNEAEKRKDFMSMMTIMDEINKKE
ncbi:MAG: hypothetical protein ACRCW9_04125 [Cetobacterium sp.]